MKGREREGLGQQETKRGGTREAKGRDRSFGAKVEKSGRRTGRAGSGTDGRKGWDK